ncbi:hypothetical protein B0H14DRAFT_3471633 [Mycena olivaceomarginata]|nr:hypothetical protein B0H14DRAFT_3471633 [Mycena olivaceomarginata]
MRAAAVRTCAAPRTPWTHPPPPPPRSRTCPRPCSGWGSGSGSRTRGGGPRERRERQPRERAAAYRAPERGQYHRRTPAPALARPRRRHPRLATTNPALNFTPATPISPAEPAPPPPLRRARSQTAGEGRNWSRPSSVHEGADPPPTVTADTDTNADADAASPTPSTIYATAPSSVLSVASTATVLPPNSHTHTHTHAHAHTHSQNPNPNSNSNSTASHTATSINLNTNPTPSSHTPSSSTPSPSPSTSASSTFSATLLVRIRLLLLFRVDYDDDDGAARATPQRGAYKWAAHDERQRERRAVDECEHGRGRVGCTPRARARARAPPGAARAADPHAYSPVSGSGSGAPSFAFVAAAFRFSRIPDSSVPPSAFARARASGIDENENEFNEERERAARRASVVSFASGTSGASADSWATALAGDEGESGEGDAASLHGDLSDGVREEGWDGRNREKERERADTLRGSETPRRGKREGDGEGEGGGEGEGEGEGGGEGGLERGGYGPAAPAASPGSGSDSAEYGSRRERSDTVRAPAFAASSASASSPSDPSSSASASSSSSTITITTPTPALSSSRAPSAPTPALPTSPTSSTSSTSPTRTSPTSPSPSSPHTPPRARRDPPAARHLPARAAAPAPRRARPAAPGAGANKAVLSHAHTHTNFNSRSTNLNANANADTHNGGSTLTPGTLTPGTNGSGSGAGDGDADVPPWGPNGLALGSGSGSATQAASFHPRARTASAGYSYTPASPVVGRGAGRFSGAFFFEFTCIHSSLPFPPSSFCKPEFTDTTRQASPQPIPSQAAARRASRCRSTGGTACRFNAAGQSPGGSGLGPGMIGNGAGANEVGRLSPSIISPVWQRLPAFPALPDLSAPALPAASGSGSAGGAVASGSGSGGSGSGGGGGGEGQGSVGRRSSVIFGPHGREASRSVVRSMPALAMEGAGAVEVAAGESDEEDGEGEGDMDMDGDEQAQDGEDDDAGRESRDGQSPFVPLAPPSLSLDIAGMLGRDKKGKGRARAATVDESGTTRAIHAQPLRQQVSQGSSVGKTPTAHPAWTDYFSVRTPTSEGGRTPRMQTMPVSPGVRAVPMPPLPAPERPGMYKHVSRSMVDILQTPISVADPEDDEVEPVDVISGKGKGKEPSDAQRGEAPAYDGPLQRAGTVKRRRSMPEIMAAPPPYTMPLFTSPFFNLGAKTDGHPLAQARIVPRDDEGREVLPKYSNEILLRGVMPRKMEFSAPGVQARDRKWRRVVCELEGTVFRVYRCAGEGWWERRVGVGDAAATSAVTSAAAAVKAREAAAAAKEGQAVNKIAGEEGRIPVIEGGEGEGTTEVVVPPRSSMSSARSRASSIATTPPSPSSSPTESNRDAASMASSSASRSRLNLGLSLLKPRSHGRSKSDLPNPPKSPNSPPRASLSIPRPSFGGSSGSSGSGSAGPSTLGAALRPSRNGKGKQKSTASVGGADAAGTDVPEPEPADLIRAYTLQHAESGLGNDYVKRKHVIRVRLEGEQFLLQARDVGMLWTGLSATNIALDLDERIMPKGPLFPRRRRRRPRPANGAEATTNTTDPPAARGAG